jgi:hypothetical protein
MSSNTVAAGLPRANPNVFNPRENGSDYFWYNGRALNLANATPIGNIIINFDADSNYYLVALTYCADIAGAAFTESTWPLPLITLNFVDSGSGKALMNQPVLLPAMMGDGKRPYRLVRPRVFMANASIQLALNASLMAVASPAYNVSITLHGYKVYV